MAANDVRFLVFDVESVADGRLVAKIRYPDEQIEPTEAVRRYREELVAKYQSDFIPYTYQVPVSVVAAKVASDFRLLDIVSLDEPRCRPHVITEKFWRGWEAYQRPTLVTFNGRSFDVPLLELAAFRFGVSVPGWFDSHGPNFKQPRYRYNTEAHFDLYDLISNHGATRLAGGLNLLASQLGKPGKMSVQGDMVQDLYDQGKLAEINDYCRCDVLDTYFVFLRAAVLQGLLSLEREQELIAESKRWLLSKSERTAAYRTYLDHWGDWENPWAQADS